MQRFHLFIFSTLSVYAVAALAENDHSQLNKPDEPLMHKAPKMVGRAEMPEKNVRMTKVNDLLTPNEGNAAVPVRPKNQLSADERRALRQQVNEAGSMYGKQR